MSLKSSVAVNVSLCVAPNGEMNWEGCEKK